MASPYIRDYRHYNQAGADPISIQRPSYQPGDIILVIYNSGDWSASRQPRISGFTQLNPHVQQSNEPFNLRVIFYKTATENEPSTYSVDVNGGYSRTTVTIMTIANAEYAQVFNTQSYNASLGSVAKDSLVICSLTVNGAPSSSNGPYSLFVTGLTSDTRQHPIYQKSYSANQQIVSASTSASWNSTYMIYLVFTEKNNNKIPTQPGSIEGIAVGDTYLKYETVNLSWEASTDPDGDSITYELDITKDGGKTWTTLRTGITSGTFNVLMNNIDSDAIQFRVRAKDSKGGYSNYSYSQIFKTVTKLILVQDGDIIKTFKNGSWQVI